MSIKKKMSEKIFEVINTAVMVLVIIIALYPMLHVLFASLSDSNALMGHRGILIHPLGLNFNAYEAVLNNPMILKGYQNTLFILVVGVSINLLMTSLGAYFLASKDVLIKKPIMMFIVFTMFFNGGLIPTFLNIQSLGLLNNIWVLILPFAINTFNLIIMRTSFMAIPDSLEESATIDGANDFIILFRIILPLSMPVIAVMILYYGVYHWNSWFFAMIYIRERTLFPLQVILREILIQNDTNFMSAGDKMKDQDNIAQTIKYATIIVATLPILFIYPILQKYFVKGVMIGALKG